MRFVVSHPCARRRRKDGAPGARGDSDLFGPTAWAAFPQSRFGRLKSYTRDSLFL